GTHVVRRRGNRIAVSLLRCVSPVLAQSGQIESAAICPLSGVSGHRVRFRVFLTRCQCRTCSLLAWQNYRLLITQCRRPTQAYPAPCWNAKTTTQSYDILMRPTGLPVHPGEEMS